VVADVLGKQPRPEELRVDVATLARALREQMVAARVFREAATDAGGLPVARVRVDVVIEEVTADKRAAARAGSTGAVPAHEAQRPTSSQHSRWWRARQLPQAIQRSSRPTSSWQ
jgi:hypothetical protein